ncbi:hypothetical protein [Paenibacillus turpanensis]|uniref:hypothetical protein n=1 Tax=Paenibacillus turpanensis TaxID=2689078 RepID=UPI00140A1E53|nr:hypothetical protein [Paenibacillus turpanensis]
MESTICQWCDTEIVWDEEIGPEETCPHCFNEVGNYRTLKVNVDNDRDVEREEEPEDSSWNFGPVTWNEDEDEELAAKRAEDERYRKLRSAAREYTESQEEAPECAECREFMVQAGVRTVEGNGFTATVPPGVSKPFLETPFELAVFVCPSCFHVSEKLSPKDREKLLNRF